MDTENVCPDMKRFAKKEEAEAMNMLNTEVKKASRGVLVGGLIMAASFVALAYGLLGMLLR
jgi:hypothetical protein